MSNLQHTNIFHMVRRHSHYQNKLSKREAIFLRLVERRLEETFTMLQLTVRITHPIDNARVWDQNSKIFDFITSCAGNI